MVVVVVLPHCRASGPGGWPGDENFGRRVLRYGPLVRWWRGRGSAWCADLRAATSTSRGNNNPFKMPTEEIVAPRSLLLRGTAMAAAGAEPVAMRAVGMGEVVGMGAMEASFCVCAFVSCAPVSGTWFPNLSWNIVLAIPLN